MVTGKMNNRAPIDNKSKVDKSLIRIFVENRERNKNPIKLSVSLIALLTYNKWCESHNKMWHKKLWSLRDEE